MNNTEHHLHASLHCSELGESCGSEHNNSAVVLEFVSAAVHASGAAGIESGHPTPTIVRLNHVPG